MEILKREDVKKEYTWAIEDIFETKAAWEDALKKMESLASELKAYKGT